MASIAPTSALLRVGVLGQLVAAAFLAAALGAGIWVAMGSPSPFFAFWDTALRFFTWGLVVLGLSWTGESFAGKRHHPDFLRAGALFVVVSALVLWWRGEVPSEVRIVHLDRVIWAAGAASLVFFLAQMLDYSRGRPLARIGFVKIAGVAIILAGIGTGVWAVYYWIGEYVSLVGRGTHWDFFWSWFQLKGLFGLLIIGFTHLVQGLEGSRTMGRSSSAKNVLRAFGGWGQLVAAVLFAAALGVGVWQAMDSSGPFWASTDWSSPFWVFWISAQRVFTWGLLILGLVWIGDSFGGRRHHPDFLRIGALLVVVSGIVLGWRVAGSLDDSQAWYEFTARAVSGVGAASTIFLLAQTLDYSRRRPLTKIRLVKMVGLVVIAAGIGVSILGVSNIGFGPDTPNSSYWSYFWTTFRIPALFGLLTIGFAEVIQGLAASNAVAQGEPEVTEPQTAL